MSLSTPSSPPLKAIRSCRARLGLALACGLAFLCTAHSASGQVVKILSVTAVGEDVQVEWDVIPGQQLPFGAQLEVRDPTQQLVSSALLQDPNAVSLAPQSVVLTDALNQVALFGRQYTAVVVDSLGQPLSAAFPYHLLAGDDAGLGCGYHVVAGAQLTGAILVSSAMSALLDGLDYCSLRLALQGLPADHVLACEIRDLIAALPPTPFANNLAAGEPKATERSLHGGAFDALAVPPQICEEPCGFFWQAVIEGSRLAFADFTAPEDATGTTPGFYEATAAHDGTYQCVEMIAVGLPNTLMSFGGGLDYEDQLTVELRPRRKAGEASCGCAALASFKADLNGHVEAVANSPHGLGNASAMAGLLSMATAGDDTLFSVAVTTSVASGSMAGSQDSLRNVQERGQLVRVPLPAVGQMVLSGSASTTALGNAWSYAGFLNSVAEFKVSGASSCVVPATATVKASQSVAQGNKLSRWPRDK